jgi:hypothetical protein
VINAIAGNSYVATAGARFPMTAVSVAAAWQPTDAVRPHVMADELKRTSDVFPSRFRGMDPPV